MTFIQELVTSALKDEYFKKLLNKTEIIYGKSFLKKQKVEVLTEKEVNDPKKMYLSIIVHQSLKSTYIL